MAHAEKLLLAARHIRRHLHQRHSLQQMGAACGISPHHLQREFTRLAGESPRRYARRLQLLQAAAGLLGSERPLRRIARECGFASVEVLIRNFQRDFGCAPEQYRRRHRAWRRRPGFVPGLRLIARVAPCTPLYHLSLQPRSNTMPMLSAALRTLQPQPALVIRSRIARSEIAATIGQSLGRIVPYALGAGGALAGQPFTRYPEAGTGLVTIEVGMPLLAPVAGEGDIESLTLPGGFAAVAVHGGSYEQLAESYAALERWLVAGSHEPAGAPWEVYVTDPADHPDPADWRTEIYWPVR